MISDKQHFTGNTLVRQQRMQDSYSPQTVTPQHFSSIKPPVSLPLVTAQFKPPSLKDSPESRNAQRE